MVLCSHALVKVTKYIYKKTWYWYFFCSFNVIFKVKTNIYCITMLHEKNMVVVVKKRYFCEGKYNYGKTQTLNFSKGQSCGTKMRG